MILISFPDHMQTLLISCFIYHYFPSCDQTPLRSLRWSPSGSGCHVAHVARMTRVAAHVRSISLLHSSGDPLQLKKVFFNIEFIRIR